MPLSVRPARTSACVPIVDTCVDASCALAKPHRHIDRQHNTAKTILIFQEYLLSFRHENKGTSGHEQE
jgi:hypothetical protein